MGGEHPYRSGGKKDVKRLPRFRARVRGMFRRIFIPTMVVGATAGVAVFAIAIMGVVISGRATDDAAHFKDWQNSIEKRQHDVDVREADIKARHVELDAKDKAVKDAVVAAVDTKSLPTPVAAQLGAGTYYEQTIAFRGIEVHRMNDHENRVVCYVVAEPDFIACAITEDEFGARIVDHHSSDGYKHECKVARKQASGINCVKY